MKVNDIPGKVREFLVGLGILIGFLYLGEWISPWIPFPLPGSVIGMLLIFAALSLGIVKLPWINLSSTVLLSLLGLFFVPYGVGIMEAWSLVRSWEVSVVVIALAATVLTCVVAGYLFKKLKKT